MQDASAPFRFDAANIERLYQQDQLAEVGIYPWWPSVPLGQCDFSIRADNALMVLWTPDFKWYGLDLSKLIADLRNAVLLPFCEGFSAWLARLLECAEREYFAREARERDRIRRVKLYGESDWAAADLYAEVSAVAGQGRKAGGEYWFPCPFHNDRDPSLEVNPDKRVWHCWGCGAAGGVVDWRRRVGA